MVCPVCIIPLVSGATALGTGSTAFSKKSSKIRKCIFFIVTAILVFISIYFLYYRKKLAEDCDTCKIE